jgi:uncharacterized protein (TIGR00730 family)
MLSVCVFSGSSFGNLRSFREATEALARTLVAQRLRAVYGGGRPGLMGVFADAIVSSGGEVVGVIPKSLADLGLAHPALTSLHVVASMHDRKAKMSELSDGFIALPGGLGTLEESFEVWSWALLGLHKKPLGLLNVHGFFDGLLGFVDHAVEQGFVKSAHRDMVVVEREPEALLERMKSYQPPNVQKVTSADLP